jgi:thiol-disulfide isomerase/thioredoxin
MKPFTLLVSLIVSLQATAQVVPLSFAKIPVGSPISYEYVTGTMLDSANRSLFVLPSIVSKGILYNVSIPPSVKYNDVSFSKQDKELATFKRTLLFYEDADFSYFAVDANNDRNFTNDSLFKEVKPQRDKYLARSFQFSFPALQHVLRKDSSFTSERMVYPRVFRRNNIDEFVLLSSTYREGSILANSQPYKIGVHTSIIGAKMFTSIYFGSDSAFMKKIYQKPNTLGDTLALDNQGIIFDAISTSAEKLVVRLVPLSKPPKGINEGEYYTHFTAEDYFTKQPISTVSNSEKGVYTLLDFWGTWCGPCIQSLPELTQIINANRGRKIDMISVAVERKIDSNKIDSMVRVHGLTWKHIVLSGNDNLGKVQTPNSIFRINSFPTFMVLAPDGKIVLRLVGSNHFKELVRWLQTIPVADGGSE